MDEPIELVPGLLTRLGGEVPADSTLSEVPAGRDGWLPFNVYLLTTSEEVLVLDTGPAVLHPALSDQIEAIAGNRRLSVLITRNDPEATGGLGTLIPRGRVEVLHYYGGGGLLEWLSDSEQGAGSCSDLFGAVPVDNPWQLPLGEGRELSVFRTPLSVLNTVWVHDSATGALFTSDALGIGRAAGEALVSDLAEVSGEESRAWLACRFDWIDLLDSNRLTEDLAALVDPLHPALLCPSHGRIVAGREAAVRFLGRTFAALVPAPAQGG